MSVASGSGKMGVSAQAQEYTGGTSSCQKAAERKKKVFWILVPENLPCASKSVCKCPPVPPSRFGLPGCHSSLLFLHTHTLTAALWALSLQGIPWCSRSQAVTCVKLLLRLGVEVSRYDSAGPCAPARKPLIPGCGFQPSSPCRSAHSQQAAKACHKRWKIRVLVRTPRKH